MYVGWVVNGVALLGVALSLVSCYKLQSRVQGLKGDVEFLTEPSSSVALSSLALSDWAQSWVEAQEPTERVLVMNDLVAEVDLLSELSRLTPRALGRICFLGGCALGFFLLAISLAQTRETLVNALACFALGGIGAIFCQIWGRRIQEQVRHAAQKVRKILSQNHLLQSPALSC